MEITEAQRINFHPGDRLFIKANGLLTQDEAHFLADQVRDRLHLGSQFPILITDDSAEIAVVSAPDAEKWFDGQMQAWKRREANKIRANGGRLV